MPAADNPVIQAIQRFPANSVYFLATKKEVVEGFQHHQEMRVESYVWKKEFSVLEANLRVRGAVAVSFSAANGTLNFRCNCHQWTPESNCAHVVGALLTTANLLAPHLFQRRRDDSAYRDSLKRMLVEGAAQPLIPAPAGTGQPGRSGRGVNQPTATGSPLLLQRVDPTPQDRFAIVLENSEGVSHVEVQRNYRAVYFGHGPHLPKELVPVSYWHDLSKATTRAAFVDYLAHHASKHPILVKTPLEGLIEVGWDPSLRCRRQTGLDLTAEGVRVEAICFDEDRKLQRFECFGNLAADLDERRLGLIEEGQGWSLYLELHRIHLLDTQTTGTGGQVDGGPLGSGSFLLSLSGFRRIQVSLPRTFRPAASGLLSLRVDGRLVDAQPGKVKPRLTIDRNSGAGGRPGLIAKLVLDDDDEIRPHSVFDFFHSLESSELPGGLHS